MEKQDNDTWWERTRNVTILVDNDSWIIPWAQRLAELVNGKKDIAVLARTWRDIRSDGICFFLGCVEVVPKEILKKNHKNLVVHESALPEGKGFSPLTWQILEGKQEIPITLLEAGESVDAGPIVYTDMLQFEGHELCEEIRTIQGSATVDMCTRYLSEPSIPQAKEQTGKGNFYPKRKPKDSRLNINKSIAEQFNLLRVVDNERYPAFFELNGITYQLSVQKKTEKTVLTEG